MLSEPPYPKFEWKGQYLKLRCDVANDVIMIKDISFNILCYSLYLSEKKIETIMYITLFFL